MKKSILILMLLTLLFSFASCLPTDDDNEKDALTYEEFWNMSGSEQAEYKESFENVEDFYAWYQSAKEQYEKDHPMTDIENGEEIELGQGN